MRGERGEVLEAWVGFVGFHDFGGEEEEDPYAVVRLVLCWDSDSKGCVPCAHDDGVASQDEFLEERVDAAWDRTECCQLSTSCAGIQDSTSLRPVNSANVTSVPYSDSKRSTRGITAIRLKIMWKKLRCMTGNKLSRCTIQ
jgi:hypothetical protein